MQFQVLFGRLGQLGVVADDVFQAFFEARAVVHQVAHGDRLVERRGNLEVQVVVDIAVQVDLALLDQLHHGHPGEQLGGGAGAHHARFRVHRDFRGNVGHAVAFLQQHLAVLDHDHDGAGDVAGLERVRNAAIKPGGEVGGFKRLGAGRAGQHRADQRCGDGFQPVCRKDFHSVSIQRIHRACEGSTPWRA